MTRAKFLKIGDQFKQPMGDWHEIAKTQVHHSDKELVYFITDEGRTFLFPLELLLESA